MDPLAGPLACDCVKGYAQRKYEKLGEFLTKHLSRKVNVVWGETLESAMEKSEGKVDIIVGSAGAPTSLAIYGVAAEAKAENFRRIDQAQYIGSKKCAECHAAHFDGWKDTAHNKMIRVPVADGPQRNVLADFSKPSDKRNFEFKDVKWVIGSRWKQRFIGDVNGQEVVFPA